MTSVEQHIRETSTIVSCRVIKLLDTEEFRRSMISSSPDRSYSVDVVITHVYKGEVRGGDTLRIAPPDPSNCDLYFRAESEYVLFGEINETDFMVRTCSYSEPIELAEKVLAALRQAQLNSK